MNILKTNNLKVASITPIIAPADLRQVFPLSQEASEFVSASRSQVKNIIRNRDHRLMAVVGPCSIHDPKGALEYAGRLSRLADEIADQIFVVMRLYFEKPRTTIGWKGLVNDPDMNGTHQISKGLGIARRLLCDITQMMLPIATEMLDPITPEYLADHLTFGAIGARTTESQTHREMASGLSFPIGFKNGTDGNLQVALDAMNAALHSHSFLGINREGLTSIVRTTGNPDVHLVLRGGSRKPNYYPEDIADAHEMLEKSGFFPTLMVDCSHGNSNKDHLQQPDVLRSVIDQIVAGNRSITGVMIESNIEEGSQSIPKEVGQLKYGVSITDKCVDWPTTELMLREAADRLRKNGGRPIGA
jgi:3-deoxy-7-phosphoheptulonate synthase